MIGIVGAWRFWGEGIVVLAGMIAPILSLFAFILGNSLLTTMLSLNAHGLVKNSYIPALIAAGFFAGLVIGSIKAITYIQRVGHIRAFATFAALAAMICLLQGLIMRPWAWVGFRFFGGFACAGLYLVVESWLLANSNEPTRGRLLAIYMCTFYLAQSLGQLLLEIIDLHHLSAYCWVAICFALSILPVSFTRRPSPEIVEPSMFSFRELYKLSPLSVIGCSLAGMVVGPLYTLAPIYVLKATFFSQ